MKHMLTQPISTTLTTLHLPKPNPQPNVTKCIGGQPEGITHTVCMQHLLDTAEMTPQVRFFASNPTQSHKMDRWTPESKRSKTAQSKDGSSIERRHSTKRSKTAQSKDGINFVKRRTAQSKDRINFVKSNCLPFWRLSISYRPSGTKPGGVGNSQK